MRKRMNIAQSTAQKEIKEYIDKLKLKHPDCFVEWAYFSAQGMFVDGLI